MQPQPILRECTVGTVTSRNEVAARVAHPIKANQLEQSDIKYFYFYFLFYLQLSSQGDNSSFQTT